MRVLALVTGLAIALGGCAGGGGSGTELKPGPAVEGFAFSDRSEIHEGSTISVRFTCDGDDISPGLAWQGVPEGTEELALVLEDPDAPSATFSHWIVYGIDPTATSLATTPRLTEGRNDFGHDGYEGPCPPGGEEHRYVLRLLALDGVVELEPGADRAAFDEAVAPHVLAEARLTAPYRRV